ncbi:helicase-exonuclease AddAB subunit AddA [Chengkuizengella axinellae]|uniref:ATP-dependent helicase/nuclease subunit A n=1 Tax=Chengkuizengella axinellae TaxID=3064388 RepID=A0ABT9IUR7_9BACL|nr:helicase-exonuclease AddAB subunit AddA [Chengkuizengella sp. 2205SS18-9]MDP5273081.1 helicase-exonuclease AddAB subunit AddA [Chengkuizengella sp. 2205SS18-9]
MNRVKSVPKPKDSYWTDDQWSAISTRGDNVLVSAAAGSGKTAVLVERIIRLISSEEDKIDVDRLLVATFTKAAASEMRHRIREALEKALSINPHSGHLKKQLTLIHKANITTLHSFCLEVIQQNFHSIQMDPKFRIGNDTETELIRQDVLEELFEHHYESSSPDSDFWKLVEAYTGERNDDLLFHLVLRLYHYSRSHPWPNLWLQQMADTFKLSNHQNDEHIGHGQLWLQSLLQNVLIELNGVLGLLKESLKVANKPGGPFIYVDNLLEDIQLVEQLISAANTQDWNQLYESFQRVQFTKLKSNRNQEIDAELQERAKDLRNEAKKLVGEMREELFERSPDTFYQELREIAPLMQTLVQLIQEFSERYQLAKADKGLVDYSDLEHFCLQILCDENHQYDLLPSQIARNYQTYFEEVLIDEYQDTNMVQEAILSLISKSQPGNRFMVGDVKQSIYRFRLAEPGLFLEKYKSYQKIDVDHYTHTGIKIDLSKNFRSRKEVIDGVNYIFKQLMNESVGEMVYDDKAALVYGDGFSEIEQLGNANASIQVQLIDKSLDKNEPQEKLNENESESSGSDVQDLETAQLEALNIINQINKLVGGYGSPFLIVDKESGHTRSVTYKDIVILLRSTQQWSPVFTEEFRKAGIPCYADLDSGYFEAGEVEVMLSVLKIIDNPYQDIALAAVLRSPIVQLSADEMASIRLADPKNSYYEAVLAYKEQDETAQDGLRDKLDQFIVQLENWRKKAGQGSLSDLIWQIYRETLFYDMVGGMPGGLQKQANLRLLYDRAKQYEKTSFRGLFRFLTFINQMRDRGGDLGTARALGEQENVVRLMSIHKSKGLEFPVVFVAGIDKMFNFQDLHNPFLMHKQLGFGPKYMDMMNRMSYPTLPSLAIKRRLQLEMLAEEMRILYVALTRAKEKLFLVGTVKDLKKKLLKWSPIIENKESVLPDYILVKARSYFDWLGPALLRHDNAKLLRNLIIQDDSIQPKQNIEASKWEFDIIPVSELAQKQETDEEASAASLESISTMQTLEYKEDSEVAKMLTNKFTWKNPYELSQTLLSKTSVSEMKRLAELKKEIISNDDEETFTGSLLQPNVSKNNLKRRPRFLEQKQVNAAERGTVYHTLMQHVPLDKPVSLDIVQHTLENIIMKNMITEEQREQVDISIIHAFFQSDLGKRLNNSKSVYRETPFSYGLPANEVYVKYAHEISQEIVLIQGIIDCLFLENDHFILIDYKTDAVYGNKINQIKEKYKMQIDMYTKAIETIWKIPVSETYLYLFDGAHVAAMN